MSQEPNPMLNTREFAAGWQSIVEEHVVTDLAAALQKLGAGEPGGAEVLARHLTHAFQIAAGPAGTVQAAVHYLCHVAGHAEQAGSS